MVTSHVLCRLGFSVMTVQLEFLTSATLWSLFVALLFSGSTSVAGLGASVHEYRRPCAWNATLDDELTWAAMAPRCARDSEPAPGLLEPDVRVGTFAEDSSSMSRPAPAQAARRRGSLRKVLRELWLRKHSGSVKGFIVQNEDRGTMDMDACVRVWVLRGGPLPGSAWRLGPRVEWKKMARQQEPRENREYETGPATGGLSW